MKVYKLTDINAESRKGTKWGENVTHKIAGSAKLCVRGLHAYTHPILAALLYPTHVRYPNPRLFEARGERGMDRDGAKICFQKLTTVKEIPVPVITSVQRVEILLRLMLGQEQPKWFRAWARNWLSGKDRSGVAARWPSTDVGGSTRYDPHRHIALWAVRYLAECKPHSAMLEAACAYEGMLNTEPKTRDRMLRIARRVLSR